MNIQEIRLFHRRQPFQPFDIRMSNGRVYEVDHPEFLSFSRDGKTLYYSTAEDERLVFLSVDHINSLELRNAPASRQAS